MSFKSCFKSSSRSHVVGVLVLSGEKNRNRLVQSPQPRFHISGSTYLGRLTVLFTNHTSHLIGIKITNRAFAIEDHNYEYYVIHANERIWVKRAVKRGSIVVPF